ncbi:MAG: TnpV protein [Oscillospiraceae bacterium]|nr:TnpV protein [Oscillospiraceae bacterium]
MSAPIWKKYDIFLSQEVIHKLKEATPKGVPEDLLPIDQMAWVQRMNNIRNAAEEIVNTEVIFV